MNLDCVTIQRSAAVKYCSLIFLNAINSEKLFRQIHTFLINNSVIKNNIIDLGSCIGDNSIPWAKNIKETVYAIDPSPNNCLYIKEMCKLNEISNIKTIQTAISNTNEVLSTKFNIAILKYLLRFKIGNRIISLDSGLAGQQIFYYRY